MSAHFNEQHTDTHTDTHTHTILRRTHTQDTHHSSHYPPPKMGKQLCMSTPQPPGDNRLGEGAVGPNPTTTYLRNLSIRENEQRLGVTSPSPMKHYLIRLSGVSI